MNLNVPMVMPLAVENLTDTEEAVLGELVDVWAATLTRNQLRTNYYEGKNRLKDLKVAIPPSLAGTETVIGWPAKAVDSLASRSMFDGFVSPSAGEGLDPFNLRPVLGVNQFDFAYTQAVRSQLIHSVAFWTVSAGNVSAGEPRVIVAFRSAENAAAVWDTRKRRIRAGLAVTDTDVTPTGVVPSELTLYLDDVTVILALVDGSWQVMERVEHYFGRPMMEPMAFEPDATKPFGRSRITREVMSITDSAQRQALRTEVLQEFNTAPQKYLLGADDTAFSGSKWQAYLSEVLALTKDADGDTPTFGQLPQLTPQGAISYMSHLASRFAGATGVPISSLGVIHDQPASAEAIYAAKDDLVTIAHSLNRGNQIALGNVARMIIGVLENVAWKDLPKGAWEIYARFRNPAMPSIVSQSDAMIKQISSIPWLAETTVALEELGYDEAQILRLMAEKRRAQGGTILQQLAARAPSPPVEVKDLGQDQT